MAMEEYDKQVAPVAVQEGERQEPPSPAPLVTEAAEPAIESAEAPAKAPARPKAPAKAKAAAKPKASAKPTPAKAKAPAKAEAPAKPKAFAKAEAPTTARAPGTSAGAPATDAKTSSSPPRNPTAPALVQPKEQTQRKKKATSYERFMGH